MKSQLRYILRGGTKLLLPLLLINSVFADATTDARIQAYKANKLIPEHFILPTSTNSTNNQNIVVFNSGSLTWSGSKLNANVNNSKFSDWGILDFYQSAPYGDEYKEMCQYLSNVYQGNAQSSNLTTEEAIGYLQYRFDSNLGSSGDLTDFPCNGIDFTGRNISADLSTCTGITSEQIASASYIAETTLPNIAFNGTEDLSNVTFNNVDFTNCTGLLGSQIASAGGLEYCKLAATFTGSENLSQTSLSRVDLTQCTGITGTQFFSAKNISYAKITQAQYDAWKNDIPLGIVTTIYVDGVAKFIEND